MFKEVLKEVVDNTEGGIAGLLMGMDGIPVEHYVREDMDQSAVEAVGMEFSVVLKQITTAAEMLDVGTADEVAIKAERLITVIRILGPEFFVAVTVKPEGNLGKARYLLRKSSGQLLEALT